MPTTFRGKTAKKHLGLKSKIQSRRARTNFIALSHSKKVKSSPVVKKVTERVIAALDTECNGTASSGSNMYSRVCKTIGVDKQTVSTIVYTTIQILLAAAPFSVSIAGRAAQEAPREEPLGDVVACDAKGVCHFGPKWEGQGLFEGGSRRTTRKSRKY